MDISLKDKKAFVCGSTQGIGKAAALELANLGASIVLLARNMGMKVIAEGVETKAQVEQLKRLNCEAAQGYYFSQPMCFEGLQPFLRGEAANTQILPKNKFEDVSIVMTIQ